MWADIPVPGSTRGRLVEASLRAFERDGYRNASVSGVAADAGVTTGALYHHFGSKLGLYAYVRGDLEKRLVERIAGAAESHGGSGPAALRAALLVAFDAAVRFGVPRIVGEADPSSTAQESDAPTGPDPVEHALRPLVGAGLEPAARMLTAAWRAALLSVADGEDPDRVRRSLGSVLPSPGGAGDP
ncbi:transcriptional regulator, TetR family [Beutenbergia cavernae DSM 12333]|uniref:Transcriptional regulator, TetR family n=1 Tax=Beutenbergia cavernae (strain ATCC BAA-8 / DSM 12333 / CCUG 43141 / JCM 11478 / NBRC 16432 / NCIMB 13614 / HKI 0122) TaxID=471853 RepID=C5BY22_BEUC1|nr:TetR/AcrR family transcriptional regulator [Beutenbergia cavernae]ACQ78916.1 transcriptional regulator, TetR family [Beutenbergia cavernae DSM 12333]